jgi:hypothetical protein
MHPFCESPLRAAIRQLFNGDLTGSRATLRDYVDAAPDDLLGHSLSAAVPLYHAVGTHLRLHHGNSLKRMIIGRSVSLPRNVEEEVKGSLRRVEYLRKAILEHKPADENTTFALCVAETVWRDMAALVSKHWASSFRHAQAAVLHARRLLMLNPRNYDAYFVIGFSEHLLTEIPAIVRPFAQIPGIVGRTDRAIQFLEAAASEGCYLQEFSRQMLVTVYAENRRAKDALQVLSRLVNEFPGNTSYVVEFARLNGEAG